MANASQENNLQEVEPLIVGLDVGPVETEDVHDLLDRCRQDHFSYCTTKIPDLSAESTKPRLDVTRLSTEQWRTSIVGVVDTTTNNNSKNNNDSSSSRSLPPLDWAWHMALPVVVLPPLDNLPDLKLAGWVSQAIHDARGANQGQIWLSLKVPATRTEGDTTLARLRTLSQMLQHPGELGVLLELRQPPETVSDAQGVARWMKLQLAFLHFLMGETSIRAISFDCQKSFLTNKAGYPTLSKNLQFLTTWLLSRCGSRLRVLVRGPRAHFLNQVVASSVVGETGFLPYLQYLQHMRGRQQVRMALDTEQARLEADYYDALQKPLQPLADNLDFNTYETFEKDPVKYEQYYKAIYMALQDISLQESSESRVITIIVVGAGRGPLVDCAIRAFLGLGSKGQSLQVRFWAIEKNPSAVFFLRALEETRWKAHSVKVVESDLRNLTLDRLDGNQADIVVSELLGSWGDNELSPECLQSLFEDTGVCHAGTKSIPTSYTAYLAPVASIKLHQQARQQGLLPTERHNDNSDRCEGRQLAMEIPYVVQPHMASQFHSSKECWTFAHPSGQPKGSSLEREKVLEFRPSEMHNGPALGAGYGAVNSQVENMIATLDTSDDDDEAKLKKEGTFPWTCSGLLGTFVADLYVRSTQEAVRISTVPDREFSSGMFSWFPLYMPLDPPLYVPCSENTVVQAHVRRLCRPDKVWYEWACVVLENGKPIGISAVHNQSARSYHVST